MSNPASAADLLLAPFGGEKPPAPQWFTDVLARPFVDQSVMVDGGRVVWREWGRGEGQAPADKPVLVFVHGGMAHKSWWDFIAPYFTDVWRPIGLDVPGMGQSDWRDAYTMDNAADAVVAVTQAAGGFDAAAKPAIVGHSFGGLISLFTAAKAGDRFASAVIVDIPVRPRETGEDTPARRAGGKVYDSPQDVLARFRLVPPQPCEHLYLADHVARHAIKTVQTEDGARFTWAHDPDLWVNYQRPRQDVPDYAADAQCPLAHIRAGQSWLVDDTRWAWMRDNVSADQPMVTIPSAGHHVMLDQPMALVAAIAGVLEGLAKPG